MSAGGLRVGVAAAFSCLLLVFWISGITDAPQVLDPAANILAAVNLERSGTLSDSMAPPYQPTMEREPLPAAVGSLAVRAVDGILGPAQDPRDYLSGERVRLLKHQNLFWLMLFGIGVYAAARAVGLGFYTALCCVGLTNLLLLRSEVHKYMLDSLYTEAQAAALLTLASLLLATGFTRARLSFLVGAGLVFGLLALVKASFFYIFPCILIVTIGLQWCRATLRQTLIQSIVLGAAFCAIVVPWMMRNYVNFGTAGIAGRGGETLFTRGEMDQRYTLDEYIGAYYLYAPYPLNAVLRRVFGYSREDTTRIGGRLQHLAEAPGTEFAAADFKAHLEGRPEDTYTYFLHSVAEHYRLIAELEASGDADPAVSSDRLLKERGLQLIREHPVKHLALTAMLIWRGAFFALPPLFLAFLWYRRSNPLVAILVTPALGMIVFYGFISIFTPRYSIPAGGLVIVVAVALVSQWTNVLRHRAGRVRS